MKYRSLVGCLYFDYILPVEFSSSPLVNFIITPNRILMKNHVIKLFLWFDIFLQYKLISWLRSQNYNAFISLSVQSSWDHCKVICFLLKSSLAYFCNRMFSLILSKDPWNVVDLTFWSRKKEIGKVWKVSLGQT